MKKNKNIEELTKYIIQEAQLESPSVGFTDRVMAAVRTEEIESALPNYQPVISKRGWFLIAFLLVGICSFVFTGNFENPEVLTSIDLSFLESVSSINLFEGIEISNIFLISTLLFAIFALMQLLTIKNFINRQLVG